MEEEKDNVDSDAELVQPAVPAGKSRAGLEDAEDPIPAQNGHDSSSKSPIPDVLNAGPDHSMASRSRSQKLPSGRSRRAVHMLTPPFIMTEHHARAKLAWSSVAMLGLLFGRKLAGQQLVGSCK